MANTLARPYADYFPYGISMRIPSLQYAADVVLGSPYCANFGAPLALSAAGLVAAVQMVSGSPLTLNTFTAGVGTATAIGNNGLVPHDSLTVRNGWGRNISAVASAACVRTLTINGRDYLGTVAVEVLTMNGTTTVSGLKAFQWIDSLVWSSVADVVTINVGWGNVLGLPYAGQSLVSEIKNGAVAANAGTFVAALADATASTNTNADVRGTYLPVTVIPDGVQTFELYYTTRRGNLHGNAPATS